jgi:kinetochor protein Mis14/NSL1
VEYTPWDPRLRQRVEDLARQEEELLNEIAALKKTVPAQVASDTARRYREAAARDEEAIQARRKAVEEAVASRRDGILEIDALDRQDDVESAHRGAIEGLGKVKREMPSTVAKMERARVAGEYVVSERA